jgi:hypothetical protein
MPRTRHWFRCLPLLVPLAFVAPACGCAHRVRSLPAPPAAAQEPAGTDGTRHTSHRHWSRDEMIAEAKGALGAVVTGEQSYRQVHAHY